MQQAIEEIKQRIIHFNYKQQAAWIVNANTTVMIAGRAFGKDHGVVSPVTLRNMKGMPRGATAFISPTFIKAKTDMIPALVKAWEKFGFYEEIDFWVGRYIPTSVKHEKAYEHPREPQYSIFWKNGHVIRIIGLDNKKTANGQSNDYLILNEGRFIKYEDFISRVKPTNRGNEDTFFNDLHYHHGTLITTDMPASAASKWILKFEKDMDPEQIDLIVSFDLAYREAIKEIAGEILSIDPTRSDIIKKDKDRLLDTMRDLVANGKLTEALDKRFRKELKRLEDILFELRREAVNFIKASTLDNIDAVGVRYINEMKRDLTESEFNRSILNIEIDEVKNPFYSNFSDELHGYDDINYAYVEAFEDANALPQPWRKDDDLDPLRPLHVGCDWNKAMTCAVIGQEFQHVFKMLNALYVLDPERIRHLCMQIDDYYTGFPTKKIIHHFDHTATGEDAIKEISYYKEFNEQMTLLGWVVEDHYIGKAGGHGLRNKLFLRVYAEDDINTKPIRINSTNCKDTLMKSLTNCGSTQSVEGVIKKDKDPEKKGTVPPWEAPHFTDAHDTLYIGVFQDRLGDAGFEPDATM